MELHTDPQSFNIIWQGISKQTRKKEKSGTKLEFLTIELGSEALQARLPPAKLARAVEAVSVTLIADFLTNPQIDSFVNFLSFCAKGVIHGRFFLTSLYVARDHTRNTNRACRLNEAMRAGLR